MTHPSVGPWLGHMGLVQGVLVLEQGVLVLGQGVLVLGHGVELLINSPAAPDPPS